MRDFKSHYVIWHCGGVLATFGSDKPLSNWKSRILQSNWINAICWAHAQVFVTHNQTCTVCIAHKVWSYRATVNTKTRIMNLISEIIQRLIWVSLNFQEVAIFQMISASNWWTCQYSGRSKKHFAMSLPNRRSSISLKPKEIWTFSLCDAGMSSALADQKKVQVFPRRFKGFGGRLTG